MTSLRSFTIGANDFLLDGEPFRILSGSLHYPRIHPRHWRKRIRAAKAMGLNTIETYIFWNAHAPVPGEFRLDGGVDVGAFLDIIADEGMFAIVRPGPYVCAEWDNGGLPAWLFADPTIGVRRNEPRYLHAVDQYFEAIGPVLSSRQIDQGGPIILVQIENEYGAYGSDAGYLRHLVELNRKVGITVPLTTVDQPTDEMLLAGSLPELHKTASFGSRPDERLAALRAQQPAGPLMCAEFWVGWFDQWGEHHHTTSVEQSANDLQRILELGASVNIYMVHGGSNFGLTNGANDKGTYRPIATSYDYDSPLDEAGRPTEKYWAFREVLANFGAYVGEPERSGQTDSPAPVALVDRLMTVDSVLEEIGVKMSAGALPSMDQLGIFSGIVAYDVELPARNVAQVLQFSEVRDRASVFISGAPIGSMARDHHERRITLPPGPAAVARILVEDQGRVSYGPRLGEPKGLIGPAHLGGKEITDWTITQVPLQCAADIYELVSHSPAHDGLAVPGPAFVSAEFTLERAVDLFLDSAGWGRGIAWVNGFCVGRYWSRGPQRSVFVPSAVVRTGSNSLMLLELVAGSGVVSFLPGLDLGPTEA